MYTCRSVGGVRVKKVITYGTFDLLHIGHVRLLERAKKLGDYLIVGVTSDDYDKSRGKINVRQSLMERIEAVQALNIVDEIIVEEYEGQKIDDIKKYEIDIFTVGSDWIGYFDYLEDYCKVVYLDRTEGISSSDLRSENNQIQLGLVGNDDYLIKFYKECKYVNGLTVKGLCRDDIENVPEELQNISVITDDYDFLLENVDAIYIHSYPEMHFQLIVSALKKQVHVLCESPITLSLQHYDKINQLSQNTNCILMESLRTAYSTAYSRLRLLLKGGLIGKIKMVDATCTSMKNLNQIENEALEKQWNSICAWGPNAMLPVFQILGTEYESKVIISNLKESGFDLFTKIDFIYKNAVASVKIGQGVKAEGTLVISGTKGYVYVPAPWWKTDYFEVRYENPENNKRYFYQLDGEGIRYELNAFCRAIERRKSQIYIEADVSREFVRVIQDFYEKNNFVKI